MSASNTHEIPLIGCIGHDCAECKEREKHARRDVQAEWKRGGKAAVLKTYAALHEGKLGAHWLWTAIEQIAAGANEEAVMRDYGYVSIAERDGELKRLRDENEALRANAARWNAVETLMILGDVELTQTDDGGYAIYLEPVENIEPQYWEGNDPEQVVDKVVARLGLNDAAIEAKEMSEPVEQCAWHEDDDDGYTFSTSCGKYFGFEEDPPHADFKFCPYCGCKIKFEEQEQQQSEVNHEQGN